MDRKSWYVRVGPTPRDMVDSLNTSDSVRPADVSRRDFVKSSAASAGAAAAFYTPPLTAAAHLMAPAMAGPLRLCPPAGCPRPKGPPRSLNWDAGRHDAGVVHC